VTHHLISTGDKLTVTQVRCSFAHSSVKSFFGDVLAYTVNLQLYHYCNEAQSAAYCVRPGQHER